MRGRSPLRWRASRRCEEDFAEEIAAHIALEADRLIDAGMSPEQARSAALRAFGNVTRAEERFYESRRVGWLDDLARDVRYAVRTLARNPAFTAFCVLTLAVGIGANTAVFTVLDAVLLRPLPYARPAELVSFTPARYDAFQEWTRGLRTLRSSGAYAYDMANVAGGDEPVRTWTLAVTSSLLPTLGVVPAIGRGFSAEDDLPRSTPRILLRHGFWLAHFGGDPGIVGRTIQLDGRPHEVVGVLPANLEFPPPARRGNGSLPLTADVWTGVGWLADLHVNGGFYAIGRLARGSSLAQAAGELRAAALASSDHRSLEERVVVRRVDESVIAPVRPALLAFAGGVSLVLLVACANLGNLLLARLTSRRRELAVRASLGASSGRIARQILTEACVLSCAGALAGIVMAALVLHALVALAPPELVRVRDVGLNVRSLSLTLGFGVATALLVGVLPALRARVRHPAADLGSERSATADRRSGRLQATLVAGEVALTVVLLVGAGLLLRSFAALAAVNPGFGSGGLVTADVLVPADRYISRPAVLQFFDRLEERLRARPGVQSVSAIDRLPYGPSYSRTRFAIVGRATEAGSEAPSAFNTAVRPAYFRTMGIPILQGREFGSADDLRGARVVVIGHAVAGRYWPNTSPLGSRIILFGVEREIIGVAGDVRHLGPTTPVAPMIYLPQAQDVTTRRMMTIVVRTNPPVGPVLSAVRDEIRALDRQLPVSNLRSFGVLRAERTAAERFNALVLASFAVLAVLLAAIGIFGVVSFTVAARTHEIAIRLALGASGRTVMGLVLARSLAFGAAGVVVGLSAAAVLSGWLKGMLFGLTPLDRATYVGVSGVIVLMVMLASYLPVRRATRIDPMAALRCP